MNEIVITLGNGKQIIITLYPDKLIWIAVIVAAIVAALVLLVVVRKKRKQQPKQKAPVSDAIPATQLDEIPPASIAIGKLHAQGKRSSQQDSFFVSPAEMIPTHGLLALVGDGMGGLADGDRVSQTAVSTMAEGFYNIKGEPTLVLLALLERANSAVNNLLGPSGRNKSGSTLVAGLIRDNKFYYLSVGDSRISLYRNGVLHQLNREHVFRNDLLVQAVNGEKTFQAAVTDKSAAGLTSFLGMGKLKYVDIPASAIEIQPGDRFLLMSDGVYNALPDEELKVHLDKTPEQAAQDIGAAIEAKGYTSQDNYTAVILGC